MRNSKRIKETSKDKKIIQELKMESKKSERELTSQQKGKIFEKDFEIESESSNNSSFKRKSPIKQKQKDIVEDSNNLDKNKNKKQKKQPEKDQKKQGKNDKKAAKKPPKVIKQSNEQYQQTVIDYMKQQNRPYSVNNIFDNLHGKISKKILEEILEQLSPETIIIKNFGKTKIYLYNQDLLEGISNEELTEKNQILEKTRKNLFNLKETLKNYQNQLKILTGQPTTDQLYSIIESQNKQIISLDTKMENYNDPNFEFISEEKVMERELDIQKTQLIKKQRQRIFNEMVNMLADSMQKKKAEMLEELGIEL